MTTPKPALPEPFDYCYEWDGPYGTRKFSAASHNGMKPTRSVPIYRADQMRTHAAAIEAWARAVERERCAEALEGVKDPWITTVAASAFIRALGEKS